MKKYAIIISLIAAAVLSGCGRTEIEITKKTTTTAVTTAPADSSESGTPAVTSGSDESSAPGSVTTKKPENPSEPAAPADPGKTSEAKTTAAPKKTETQRATETTTQKTTKTTQPAETDNRQGLPDYMQGLSDNELLYMDILEKYVGICYNFDNPNVITVHSCAYEDNRNGPDANGNTSIWVFNEGEDVDMYKLGYTFIDINGDGTDEMIVSQLGSAAERGFVEQCYTVRDGQVGLLFARGEGSGRFSYRLMSDNTLQYYCRNGIFDNWNTKIWIESDFSEYWRTLSDHHYDPDTYDVTTYHRSDDEDYDTIELTEEEFNQLAQEFFGSPMILDLTPMSDYMVHSPLFMSTI